MLITVKGRGCTECPFFYEDLELSHGELIQTWYKCSLDGLTDEATKEILDIKIDVFGEHENERPRSCPWNDVHCQTVEIYNLE